MWSEGVKQTENEELENVDKAVISGTQQVTRLTDMVHGKINFWTHSAFVFFSFSSANIVKD